MNFVELKRKLNICFDSKLFLIIIAVMTVVAWQFGLNFAMFTVSLILIALNTLTKGRVINMVPLLFTLLASTKSSNLNFSSPQAIIFYVIAPIVVIYLFVDFIRSKPKINTPIVLVFGLYTLSVALSIINSPVKLETFASIFQNLGYLCLFIYFFSRCKFDKWDKTRLWHIFLMFSSIILVQFTINFIDLLSEYSALEILSGKKVTVGWTLGNRVVWYWAATLILTLQQYFECKKFALKLAFLGIMTVIFILIVLTFSSGAILGLGFAFIPFMFYFLFGKIDRRFELKFIFIFLCTFAIIFLVALIIPITSDLISKIFNPTFVSENGRMVLYEVAMKVFKQHWFIGNGESSSKYFLHLYLNSYLTNYHNFVLQLLANVGIVGFAAFAGFILVVVKRNFKLQPSNIAVLSLLMYLIGHGLVDTTFHTVFIFPTFMIVLGMVESRNVINSSKTRDCLM